MRKTSLVFPALALALATAAACGGKVLPEQDVLPDASVTPLPTVDATVTEPDAGPDASESDATVVIPGFDGGPTIPLGVVDLGVVTAGVPVDIPIPPNTLGFHVTVESSTPSETLAVLEIVTPSGEKAHAQATPFGGSNPTSETLFGTTAAVQVPQSAHPEAMPDVVPGTWKAVFRGQGTLRAKVQIQSTPDGAFHGGTLDLDVYVPQGLRLSGSGPISVANAAQNREVLARLDSYFGAISDLYGLRNGNVRFHGISSSYRQLDDQELYDAFQESRATPAGQSLNIVLSEGDSQTSEWWGIAAGIPGAANNPGNEQSGLALASLSEADAELEGYVLAHETGHFFGLNHTTEISGETDPLADTPSCPDIANGNLESCPDVSNIMFAAGAAFGTPQTSPLQRRVMAGSPIFKAFPSAIAGFTAVGRGAKTKKPTLDWGKVFGHPGIPLSRGEVFTLAGACRHPSHRLVLSGADRVKVDAVAHDARVAPRLRQAAQRLVTKP